MMKIPETKQEAIKLFGGVTKLAEAVGTTKQAIHGSWAEKLTKAAKTRIELALIKKELEDKN